VSTTTEIYSSFTVLIMEDGTFRIEEMGKVPEHCRDIDSVLLSVKLLLHDPMNKPGIGEE